MATTEPTINIALAGNPNCGKTTLFNELTGESAYVGNWPGVTVGKLEAPIKGDRSVVLTDLPGIYALSPYSPEEVVSRDYLVKTRPAAVINLVDGTNLERNLYFTTQVLECGRPCVVGLNMMDVLEKRGDRVDVPALSKKLGVPVVEVSALRDKNLDALVDAAKHAAHAGEAPRDLHWFSPEVERALGKISELIAPAVADPAELRWYAVKAFERDDEALGALSLSDAMRGDIDAIVSSVESAEDDDAESIVTSERYDWIEGVVKECVHRAPQDLPWTERIDRVVTNRILGLPIFAAVMIGVYYLAVSTIGTFATDWMNDVVFGEHVPNVVGAWLAAFNVSPMVESLVLDGIVGGVGSILGFVPQMLVLFLLLCFLEDCGYMSRVAFVMDRTFRRFGLSGKSFIPMLISSGCGVPGVMSTKTIENERDRRMTIMLTTMIPCGAKLPIISLLMGALIGGTEHWWIAPLFYLLGIACVIVSAIMLKKTRPFAVEPAPFVMELPPYHWPALKSYLAHVGDRIWEFISKAGTIIFVACVGMWFLSNFGVANWEGGSGAFGFMPGMSDVPENYMNYSLLAGIGGAVAWIFAPLGFDTWQASASTLSALIAKENLVSTFGVLYGLGEVAEGSTVLWSSFAAMFTAGGIVHVGAMIAFVAFNMLDAPCFAAVGAIRSQMEDSRWFWFAIAYECAFGWVVGLIINQLWEFFALGAFGPWTVVAILALAAMLYQLFKPMPTFFDEAADPRELEAA